MATKKVMSSLGFMTSEDSAREIDRLLQENPGNTYRKKSIVSSTELVDGERSSIQMITTESLDRDRELVLSKGINVEHYQKNPVVLWNHDWDGLPLGTCQWVKKVSGGLRAKSVFSSRPENHEGPWLPDMVLSLVQQGVVKSVSIGFLPTKIRDITEDEVTTRPELKDCRNVIEEAILLEFSYVPIPANPDALIEAVSKGFSPTNDELALLGIKPVKVKKKPRYDKMLAELIDRIEFDPNRIAEIALGKTR